jgi:hypothetical protein
MGELFEGLKRVNQDFREVSRLFDPTERTQTRQPSPSTVAPAGLYSPATQPS